MVRSSVKSRTKTRLPSEKQETRQDQMKIPKKRVEQDKEKLKFSEIRSAFATYAKDNSTVTTLIKSVPITKVASVKKSQGKRQQKSTNNISEKERIHKFELSNLSEKCLQPCVTSPITDQANRSDEYKTDSTRLQEPKNLSETLSHCDIDNSQSDKSNISSCTASSSSMDPSQIENFNSFSEYDASEEMLQQHSQDEYDKYAETFLNFKNVLKSQRTLNLPDVVILPINENKNEALVGFNEGINLYGCAEINVVKGVASVQGSLLSPKATKVTFYAPLYDPALVIKSQGANNTAVDHNDELNVIRNFLKDTFSYEVMERLETDKLAQCSTVIHMSASKKTHVYPKYRNFFDAPPESVASKELCVGCFLVGPDCVLIDFPGYHLACNDILPQTGMAHEQSFFNKTFVVTVGSKGTGKSTFNRYLINSLLNHYDLVNYIDCDIGQPEFTIAGCVSVNHVTTPILGPPFTHLKNPHFSIYYGAVNAAQDASRYIESIKSAIQHVKLGYPVVVNTMGWIKGVGMKLLADIIRMIPPSHVVQLSSRREARAAPLITQDYVDQFDSIIFGTTPKASAFKHFWIKTDLPTSNLATVNPADRRLLRTFSYFTQVQNECALRDLHQVTVNDVLSLRTLCSLKPCIFYVKDALLCACHETGVLRQYALSVFNHSIISLSSVSKKHFLEHSTKKFLEPTPTSKCHGFGIVRGVDPIRQALYFVSNLSHETLLKVNCLSVGSLTIPDAIYNSDEAKSIDINTMPYVDDNFPFHITGSNRYRAYKIFK